MHRHIMCAQEAVAAGSIAAGLRCQVGYCAQTNQYQLKTLQGRNVVLEQKYGSPKIVNDGVTVAREVELEDPVENIGAKLVRQVQLR